MLFDIFVSSFEAIWPIRAPFISIIDIVSINVDIYDIDYTELGFSIYGEKKTTGGHSHVADHDEGLTSRRALFVSTYPGGGTWRLGFPHS
jgi:hypothetical protein